MQENPYKSCFFIVEFKIMQLHFMNWEEYEWKSFNIQDNVDDFFWIYLNVLYRIKFYVFVLKKKSKKSLADIVFHRIYTSLDVSLSFCRKQQNWYYTGFVSKERII